MQIRATEYGYEVYVEDRWVEVASIEQAYELSE